MIFCLVCGSSCEDEFAMKDGTRLFIHSTGERLMVCINDVDRKADDEEVFAALRNRGWHDSKCPQGHN